MEKKDILLGIISLCVVIIIGIVSVLAAIATITLITLILNFKNRKTIIKRKKSQNRLSPNLPTRQQAQIQYKIRKQQKEWILLQKFREILLISNKVSIQRLITWLNISEKELLDYLLEWKELGFKIENDIVIVDDLKNFRKALDEQFSEWQEKESSKHGKKQ
jgi:hypothetical protein